MSPRVHDVYVPSVMTILCTICYGYWEAVSIWGLAILGHYCSVKLLFYIMGSDQYAIQTMLKQNIHTTIQTLLPLIISNSESLLCVCVH